jgi:hypothetical protein
MERPAVEERIAVLETRELPGSESRIDCAFFFGSSAGTLDADRELEIDVRAGRVRIGSAGRRRAAPTLCQSSRSTEIAHKISDAVVLPYLGRFLPILMPL